VSVERRSPRSFPKAQQSNVSKRKITEYRRFRNLVRERIAVSEQIYTTQLRDREAVRATEAKKTFTDLLANDTAQEIETLVWRQAVTDLDFEALKVAVRQSCRATLQRGPFR